MIAVRRIEPQEWPLYRDVRLRALHDSPDAFGSTYDLEAARPDAIWASRIADAAASGTDMALFATAGTEVCGLAWCKAALEAPDLAHLFQMWVAPDWRRRGVGRMLVDEAIAWATVAGMRRLQLGVTVAESPAMRLYAALGFVGVGEREPLREGSALWSQTMELTLHP